MFRPVSLGDSTTTLTGVPVDANSVAVQPGVSDLEDVYVTLDSAASTGGEGTCYIQYTRDGTNWETFSSTSVTRDTRTLVGPLPPCLQIRAYANSHGTSGTIRFRAGGNRPLYLALPGGEVVSGVNVDIVGGTVATTVAASVAGCGPAIVVLNSVNYTGVYEVRVSLDGGTTWGVFATSASLSGDTARYSHTLPRCTHTIVVATTNTTNHLKSSYGAHREAQV